MKDVDERPPAPSVRATRDANGDWHFRISAKVEADLADERYRIEVLADEGKSS
jgi:hypothetical protein